VLGIAVLLAPELFTQDCVIWVALHNPLSQQPFGSPISLCNLGSICFVLHSKFLPEWQDEFTCFSRECQRKIKNLTQGRFGHYR
jgi:hypothetical protein